MSSSVSLSSAPCSVCALCFPRSLELAVNSMRTGGGLGESCLVKLHFICWLKYRLLSSWQSGACVSEKVRKKAAKSIYFKLLISRWANNEIKEKEQCRFLRDLACISAKILALCVLNVCSRAVDRNAWQSASNNTQASLNVTRKISCDTLPPQIQSTHTLTGDHMDKGEVMMSCNRRSKVCQKMSNI